MFYKVFNIIYVNALPAYTIYRRKAYELYSSDMYLT